MLWILYREHSSSTLKATVLGREILARVQAWLVNLGLQRCIQLLTVLKTPQKYLSGRKFAKIRHLYG